MNSSKNPFNVIPGTVIQGKWHKNRYTILKELGFGANGIVFLARNNHGHVALKMSDNGMSVTSEVNVLKSFAKVQGSALGPSLLDVDDWQVNGSQISFYVMEYIEGPDFLDFISQKGHSWLPVLMLQLLADLEKLHQNGWVFGDLKPENLIVTGPTPRIRCIDVGGTTLQGRAIKEFTEFYDRGYWGLGSRKAEPSYDLFAVAMVMINTAYPKRFNKTQGGLVQLQKQIEQSKLLSKFEPVILKALQGHYQSAGEMRQEFLQHIHHGTAQSRTKTGSRQTRHTGKRSNVQAATNNHVRGSQVRHGQRKRKGRSMETVLILVIVMLFYAFYIFGELI